jgi:uncharacterized protein (DUF983 family)
MADKPRVNNTRAPAIRVCHAKLQRCSEGSDYRVRCPACANGILLVLRDQVTFALINVDRCVSCGQTVVYTDKEINGEPVTAVYRDTAN